MQCIEGLNLPEVLLYCQANWSVALFWFEEHPLYFYCFVGTESDVSYLQGELVASHGYVWKVTHEEVYRFFHASCWRMDTQFQTCNFRLSAVLWGSAVWNTWNVEDDFIVAMLFLPSSLSKQQGRFDRLGCLWISTWLCCARLRKILWHMQQVLSRSSASLLMSDTSWRSWHCPDQIWVESSVHVRNGHVRCGACNSTSTTTWLPRDHKYQRQHWP